MAHKKGGGSSRNNRDSNGQRLGVKRYGGETVTDRLAIAWQGDDPDGDPLGYAWDLDGDGESTTLMALFDTGGAGLHMDPDAIVRAGGDPVGLRKRGARLMIRAAAIYAIT